MRSGAARTDPEERNDMSVRIAVNGFGRIGRASLRTAFEQESDVEFVAINDLFDAETLVQLLRRDSVYGRFPHVVEATARGLAIDGVEIPVFAERDPAALPWRELGVDVVLEATGRFRTRAEAAAHLAAGARKVIVSAPVKDPDVTVVLGVNLEAYDPERHDVISNASCTTNCLAPVAKVLHETVGIRHGLMTTVHAYTADQRLVDLGHKDARRARAAGLNIVPTTTGAAKAIGLVIPELAGKLHGYAARVPVPTGSLVDLTIEALRETSVEEIDRAFAERADGHVLAYSSEPFVSSDVIGSPHSAVYDSGLTAVVDGTQVKVVAWYDNEWGYATRLVELAELALAPVAA
jgi:glyceraldehyde 3-phosphate dehydrogenase